MEQLFASTAAPTSPLQMPYTTERQVALKLIGMSIAWASSAGGGQYSNVILERKIIDVR
jgi:hypothetical protein